MVMHALSRGCKHDNEVVLFAINSGDVEDFIVGIRKPCQVVVDTNPRHPAGLGGKVNLLEHVFSLPIQTVRSIPPSCRFLFAQVLTVWKDGSGFDDLVSSLLDSVEETGAPKGECRREEDKERGPNIKRCLQKVRDGHFTAAVKVLCSSGVAPLGDSTLKALIDKHPVVPPPSLPSNPLAQPTLVVDGECVLKCIRSFPKGTSCGRDGMRAQHLLDAVGGEGSITSSGLLASITEVVNLWLGGSCPKVLAKFVASAPLTPLLKPDKGIRPIAVGGIWRRLVSKVAMKKVGKEMTQYLGDHQFGVGVPNGAEAVLHSANMFLNSFHADGFLALLTVDFSDAFNMVDRATFLQEVHQRCPSIYRWVQFLYAQPARLYVGNECIGATTGVQQGDPLGPLLFALALHPLILRVQDRCKLPFHAWYLDDGTIIGNASAVAKALDIINERGPSLGLYLNIKKTEVFWPTCDERKVQDGLFPRGIGRPEKGVKLLGGAGLLCQTCGVEGYTNAFVYCVKCLGFVIHRYCLDVVPTPNEFVNWFCDDCKPPLPYCSTSPQKHDPSRSPKEDPLNSALVKTTHPKKKQKKRPRKKRKFAYLKAAKKDGVLRPKQITKCVVLALKRSESKSLQIPEMVGTSVQHAKTSKSKKLLKKKQKKTESVQTQKSEHSSCESSCTDVTSKNEEGITRTEEGLKYRPDHKLVSNSSSIEKELNKRSMEIVYDTQSPYFEHNIQYIHNQPARPVRDPVWRGSFQIIQTDYGPYEGFVGHLSTNVCAKVCEEATTLPSMLSLEMDTKVHLWPKSFLYSMPSDDNIALYFFPGDSKNERDFEQLVNDMIDEDLAMKATSKNAELLIFTSKVLPQENWRFQGNYYLWGVFKGKINDVPVSNPNDNNVLSAKSGNKITSEKEILNPVKSVESHSPQSPLCSTVSMVFTAYCGGVMAKNVNGGD
ncbi:hypothetical protein E3N88_45346 [Mikania micrantha]|uniref:Uncharacterized protein n=1 Tax=Mikania micrantha TaxID=192012 RepID=A0A5N6L9K7_9ASTR|nr:hypothetical protein E3N88_45346 [Mikania micrantha]